MYLSNGTKLISFLQLQATTVAIIMMLFLGDAVGSSRLTRMPNFYGKRSRDSKTSISSPDFGLSKFQSLFPSLSSSSSSSNHPTSDLPMKASLLKLLAGDNDPHALAKGDTSFLNNYIQDADEDGELKEKRTLETNPDSEKNAIRDTILTISEYNSILEKIIESNRRLQNELIGDFTEEADDLSGRSGGDDDASLVHPAPSVKRGTLRRLPQFYGRKK